MAKKNFVTFDSVQWKDFEEGSFNSQEILSDLVGVHSEAETAQRKV